MALNMAQQPVSHFKHKPMSRKQESKMVKQRNVVEYQSSDESGDSYSDSEYSEFSDDLDPPWTEEPMRTGELFYIEDNQPTNDLPDGSYSANGQQDESDLTKTFTNVYVRIDASAYLRKPPTHLLASMLGIITLEGKIPSRQMHQKVIVDALVPGGLALRTGRIKVGDILIAINDVTVNTVNIEHFLRSFPQPSKVKLTLENSPNKFTLQNFNKLKASDQLIKSSVQLLSPNKTANQQNSSLSGPNGVFFLTLNIRSDTAGENDDVLYSFPPLESPALPSKLALIRGMFVTLADSIQDTFGCAVKSSTLVVEERLVHCVYHHVDSEVFVLCFPADDYSLPRAHHTMADAVRLLSVMYGSVLQAFQPENKQRLDHLFQFLLILNASAANMSQSMSNAWKFPGIEFLSLPKDLHAHANSALAELEACDFDDGTSGRNYTRRLYTIRGSCVFYDGYILATHLPPEDLKDIALFSYNHSLLCESNKERIGLLLIWREVFPWSQRVTATKGDYLPAKGRYFWMFVGLKHSLLCVLLQMNGNLFPDSHTPRPDPMYVSKARATLLNLDTQRFQEYVKKRLECTSHPCLVQSDHFMSQGASGLGQLLKGSKPPSGIKADRSQKFPFSSPLKSKKSVDGEPSPKLQGKSQRDITIGEKTPPMSVRSLFREKSFSSQGSTESGKSTKLNVASAYSLDDIRDVIEDVDMSEIQPYKQLTIGVENALFCYLSFDKLQGTLIVPTANDLNTISSALHREIVSNFKLHCMILHQRFSCSRPDSDHCTEEGILFQCHKPTTQKDAKSKGPNLQYWVIGRSVQKPVPKEMYVCFHNSASQNMVELAFRMM